MTKTKGATMSSFEISPELMRAMDELASKRGLSRSEFIRSSIEAAIRTSPDFKARLLDQLLRIFQALARQAMARKLLSRDTGQELAVAVGHAQAEVEKSLSSAVKPSASGKPFPERSEPEIARRTDDLILDETEALWRLMKFFD
jgi:predicted DNA-binding protein